MLRRFLMLFMVLIMVCSACLGEAADVEPETGAEDVTEESTDEDKEVAFFDSWQTRIGNVVVALPGMPTACVHEGDWETYWNDSIYIWGNCAYDNMEYQLRTADIGPWIEDLVRLYPEEDSVELRHAALYDFASLQVTHQEGTIGSVGLNPETEMMFFSYTYPDAPGELFSAKAYLDGTQATVLHMGNCDHLDEAQRRFRKLTEEELAARIEDDPCWLNFQGIPMTFPCKPYIMEDKGRYSLTCFAEDFTRIIVTYSNIGLTIGADNPEEMEPMMKSSVQTEIDALDGGTILEGTVSGDESAWRYDFTFMMDNSYNETNPDAFRWRGVLIYSANGIWMMICDDTETGRAFIDSMGELTDAMIAASYRLANSTLEAAPRKKDGAPATLGQFVQDLAALLKANEDDELFVEEFVTVGEAMLCDGRWVRTVMCQAADILALLFVSSDEEDAVVNEIHVVVSEDYDKAVFDILASCCIEAAEGKTDTIVKMLRNTEKKKNGGNFQWKGERYEAVESFVDNSMPYHLMTIKALKPSELEHIPEEKENSNAFAEPISSIKQFRDWWYRLNWNINNGQFWLRHMEPHENEDGTVFWITAFGDTTVVALTTESVDESSGIIKANVYNMDGNMQQTFLGGLMTLAALTDMPDEQYLLMTMMLMEHPLWEDLLELNPVASWNGKQLVLADVEYNGEFVPTAYILDM